MDTILSGCSIESNDLTFIDSTGKRPIIETCYIQQNSSGLLCVMFNKTFGLFDISLFNLQGNELSIVKSRHINGCRMCLICAIKAVKTKPLKQTSGTEPSGGLRVSHFVEPVLINCAFTSQYIFACQFKLQFLFRLQHLRLANNDYCAV